MKKLNEELEKKVEERTRELEENQRLYRKVARNFPNGAINVLDKNLNYVFVEGSEMYKRGITGKNLIGQNFIERVNPDVRENLKNKLTEVLNGKTVNFELYSKDKTHAINAVGLRDKRGEINQILLVAQNITAMKKAEREMLRSLEREKELNEIKSRFVSTASHEFRTPLTSVMNSVNLLLKYVDIPDSKEKQIQHLERIRSSVHHLTGILNDFLSLGKLEEGKVSVSKENINLADFSREVINGLDGAGENSGRIRFIQHGSAVVNLDKNMLKNILNNLLTNAIKYSPENSPVLLRMRVEEGDLFISVSDEGMGIPFEDQHHIFERFYRASNAVNINGTGLGMNIIKKYVDMAGGKIGFISNPERGTTFNVRIPAV